MDISRNGNVNFKLSLRGLMYFGAVVTKEQVRGLLLF